MGWNQFSQNYKPREYTSAIDLDVYGKGLLLNEQAQQKSQQALQSSADNFLNIQAMSPQDEEVLNQRKKQFTEAVKGLNMSSLSNPQTKAQVNQLITQFSNDPDINAIAQRSAAYRKEVQTKKDYEEKGKNYVSPLLRQASKYIQDGNYYQDTRFNSQGFVAPETKDIDTWAKDVPEYERWVKNGAYDDHLKGKAIGSLQNKILQGFQTDPKWQQLHKDNFEQSIEGQDVLSYLDNPTQSVAELFPHLPVEMQPKAVEYIQQLQQLKGNPYAETAIKNRLENLYLQDQAYLAAEAHTYANTVDHKVNEFAKSANDFNEAKALKLYDLQLKTGLQQEKGESPASYTQRLAEAAQKKELELAQAKAKIQTDAEAERERNKQINRIELQKFKNVTKGTKEYSSNVAERVIKGLGDGTLDSDKDATALKGMILANKHKLFNPENGKPLKDANVASITIDPDTQEVDVEYEVFGDNAHYKYKYNDVLDVINDTPNYTPNSSTSNKLTPEEWNSKWSELKAGETMIGLDGKTYTK